jgi:hypothetical protein
MAKSLEIKKGDERWNGMTPEPKTSSFRGNAREAFKPVFRDGHGIADTLNRS